MNSGQAQLWDNRGHFFAAAAEAMRRILINRARDKKRLKRGGGRRRMDLDQSLRHGIERELQKPCGKKQCQCRRVKAGEREQCDRKAPQHGENEGRARIGVQAAQLQQNSARQGARGIGSQQHAVQQARVAVAEIAAKFRHLRLIGIGDDQRRRTGQQDHRQNDAMRRNRARGVDDVGQTTHGGAARGRICGAEARPVGRSPQPQQ